MKIRHYITFDTGAGPVSLISFDTKDGETMIRITHNAKFGRVAEVNASDARTAIAAAPDLGMASTVVPAEYADVIGKDALAHASRLGCAEKALRWGEGGQAILFMNDEAARSWDATNDEDHGALTRRRRRIMMD